MPTFVESLASGSFVESESPGSLSRDRVIVLSGQVLRAGAVLGCVFFGSAVSAAFPDNAGNGTMTAVVVAGNAKIGDYKLVFIEPSADEGIFVVQDPDGVTIGNGSVGAPFSAGGIAFTLNDGDADFTAGDGFVIAVTGALKFVEYDNATQDGRDVARAVLLTDIDAAAGEKPGVAIVRKAEVKKDALVWRPDQDAAARAAGIEDLAVFDHARQVGGIIAR